MMEMTPRTASVRETDVQPNFTSTSFATQTNALLRKNLTFQKRNWRTNACLVVFPLQLCIVLVVIQLLINSLIGGSKFSCGCACVPVNGSAGCEKRCGIQYSDQDQVSSCAILSPTEWPALLQVPRPQYRAVDNHNAQFPGLPDASCRDTKSCPATFLYTGQNQTLAEVLAGNLLVNRVPANLSGSLPSLSDLVPGTQVLSWSSYYIEPAFVSNEPLYVLQNVCKDHVLNIGAPSLDSQPSFSLPFTCLETLTLWRDNSSEIDKELFQGYRKGNPERDLFEIPAAYDFLDSTVDKLNLNIWFNSTLENKTTNGVPPSVVRVPRMMNLAVQAFLRLIKGPTAELPLWFIKEMPKPETKLRLDFSSLLGPLFFMWVIQLLFPVILTSLVYERQQKLRLMMKMHGLGDRPYWLITYGYFLALSLVYIFGFILFGSVVGLKIFRLNDYSIQLVFYVIYLNLQIALAFFVATFFSNVRTATVCGYLYVFGFGLLGYFLFQFFLEDHGTRRSFIFAMELLPGFSLFRGLYEFSTYAFTGDYMGSSGMRWKNLQDHENGLKAVFGIMLVEWPLFLLLAYYCDQVIASGSGLKKHPLFFLGRKNSLRRFPSIRRQVPEVNVEMDRPDVIEERNVVEGLRNVQNGAYAIICDNLKKVYPGEDGNADKFAVRGLSLAIQRGECFGMLGPNGAGKTTSINMMTGFLAPTSGTALIQGLDIMKEIEKIYTCMGVCPQHDLIWETLTGREHLLFYGRLKNLEGAALESFNILQAVEASLKSVNLFNGGQGNKQVGKYSGGMKRRLSVAISLIGDPKVVYMDEPSTGLDPASRSNLWSVIKQAKQGRAIILTTHSMEEANVLCDRLGIFVNGQLQCIGNPSELRARYGGSFVLTITTPQDQEVKIIELVELLSPTAKKIYGLSGTQKFELPKSEVSIADIFKVIDTNKAQLQFQAWGIANTTLEDVFIKVAREANAVSEK
ncbi:hypothetical protein O6H91_10G048600 [Diphasiastrum complanatum]|uniref:Uncharacterized protein n=2 Tax=Diphasiastrum complanatum TaxID=34168 RepID=A0ACC2CGM4_DIPCM|nr:hypothetical protein O6H91_10G048600 [Diphasiastrum complanatum]KAJ7541152.1 hypothetical protein O6H91_10G048600 [Diphasiastrum complanatum]